MDSYKYVTYLIGAMEITAEGDSGETKREKIVEDLNNRKVFPIDPSRLEGIRTGMTSAQLSEKLTGWVASGHWESFDKYMDLIWKGKRVIEDGNITLLPGDIHYVEMSDWITAIFNKGDSPCGTYGEAFYAYKLGKPIYLITNCPKKDLAMNFIGWIDNSGGRIFSSRYQYLEFIDKKYSLKVEKNGE